jgi:preprotein translocase SecE subunit
LSEENMENIPANKVVGTIPSIKQTREFLESVRQEVKLVQRPSFEEVRSTTVVVIVFLLLSILYFYALGRVFSLLDRWIMPR